MLKRVDLMKGQLDLAAFHVEFAYIICRVLLGIGSGSHRIHRLGAKSGPGNFQPDQPECQHLWDACEFLLADIRRAFGRACTHTAIERDRQTVQGGREGLAAVRPKQDSVCFSELERGEGGAI
jgi:hypothetical protein